MYQEVTIPTVDPGMKPLTYLILILAFVTSSVNAQHDETYFKTNAIRIVNPENLNNSIYDLLSPYQIIMFGEMHGTNESAPFVKGLVNLFTRNGDSVLVGLEIPSLMMSKFDSLHTDSSIYQSVFFTHFPPVSGKESLPWAALISYLNSMQNVRIFFFDVNDGECNINERDSLMAAKTKSQFEKHPDWKIVTLSGNYHNRISDPSSMTSVLKRNISAKICSLNMEYNEGSVNANFGKGLEIKRLGSYPSFTNSTEGFHRYILLQLPQSNYDYDGFYYTKSITPAKMTTSE